MMARLRERRRIPFDSFLMDGFERRDMVVAQTPMNEESQVMLAFRLIAK